MKRNNNFVLAPPLALCQAKPLTMDDTCSPQPGIFDSEALFGGKNMLEEGKMI